LEKERKANLVEFLKVKSKSSVEESTNPQRRQRKNLSQGGTELNVGRL